MSDSTKVNCKCSCDQYLASVNDELVGLLPCQHLSHTDCINKIRDRKCQICHAPIALLLTYSEIRDQVNANNYTYYPMFIDMLCVRNTSSLVEPSYWKLMTRSPMLSECLGRLALASNIHDVERMVRLFSHSCGLKIVVEGEDNIIPDRKIIISNHTGYLDPIPIYRIFKCGFLSSEIIKDVWYLRRALKVLPLLIVKRGSDKNTVDRMRDYLKNKGDLCVFPEGLITHPQTIARFRTGAFHVGYPIQPVIITYTPHVYDNDYTQFLVKAVTQDKITMKVKILPAIYPPYSHQDVEEVRDQMAKTGNFALSRVTNRSIHD